MQRMVLCSCVPLVAVVALLLLQQGATVDAKQSRSVACPELQASRVCAEAEAAGLAYNDGCNRVRCLDNGQWASSRRGCPQPESPAERRQCRVAAHDVFQRLGPFQCANIQRESVCAGQPARSILSDGCNGIVCDGAGNVASSTMNDCPAGNPEGAYCQFVADTIRGSGADGSGSESGDRRRRSQQEYACPDLAPSAVCTRSTNGFSYSDGCNGIKCHGDGVGQSTLKYCPEPEESDQASQTYCHKAEQEMRAKMQRASVRSRCLSAEDVCQGPNVRQIAYNDGCNRCMCVEAGQSACTRRGCPRFLMTDDEFADYCKEVGAGVH